MQGIEGKKAILHSLEKISGIILAGGKSSRFGVDKALHRVSSGKLLIEFVIEALFEFCDEIIVAGLDSPFLHSFDKVRIVRDEPGVEGPFAGIMPALHLAKNDVCAVVGCDMPFASPHLFIRLASVLKGVGALICVPEKNGNIEPLHAVYSRKVLPMLIDFVGRGGRSLTEFIKWCRDNVEDPVQKKSIIFYRYGPKRYTDSSCDPFFNINTMGEFEYFENYCKKGI